jgi:hypothetical protein
VDTAVRASAVGLAMSVVGSIADARAQADDYPASAEMTATYVALGELLEANRHIGPHSRGVVPDEVLQQYEDDCRDLVTRLIELERPMEHEYQQQWARWCAKYMNGGASDGA